MARTRPRKGEPDRAEPDEPREVDATPAELDITSTPDAATATKPTPKPSRGRAPLTPESGSPIEVSAPPRERRPSLVNYLLERWTELIDDNKPWWAISPGLGIRMTLRELNEMAVAQGQGVVNRDAIKVLKGQALLLLAKQGSYTQKTYPEVTEMVRGALGRDDPDGFVPGGSGPAGIRAALSYLDDDAFVPRLVSDLAMLAGSSATTMDAYRAVDELVELLDAELAFDGHSTYWRQRVIAETRTEIGNGVKFDDALTAVLERNHHRLHRKFDILLPVERLEQPTLAHLLVIDADIADEVLRDWDEPSLRSEATASTYRRITPIDAVDGEAAAGQAHEVFRREAARVRLAGGEVDDAKIALVFDADLREGRVVKLPVNPLQLFPDGFGEYKFSATSERTKIENALAQLTEARIASPPVALADLWSAAEAAFGGTVTDPRYEAAEEMAGLASYLFTRSMLKWLYEQCQLAGIEPGVPGFPEHERALHSIANSAPEMLAALAVPGHALAWVRFKTACEWDQGQGFGTEIETVHTRVGAVCSRAYLIRNLIVHTGDSRSAAVSVTLSAFASIIRACLGHILTTSGLSEPLMGAKFATLQARRVAQDLASGARSGPEGLNRVLSD